MTALLKNKQTTHEIGLKGQAAILDLTGAIYLPDARCAARGRPPFREGLVLCPARHDAAALRHPRDPDRPCDAVSRFAPQTVIALGDSFHDIGGPGPARATRSARRSAEVQAGRDWIWVTGNHDRILPDSIGGQVVEEMALGSLTLRHEPAAGEQAEIAGHLHPVGKVVMRGRATRRRCFLTDGIALRHAGARRLCGRAQCLRCRLQAALPERLHRASHRHRADLRHREVDALPGLGTVRKRVPGFSRPYDCDQSPSRPDCLRAGCKLDAARALPAWIRSALIHAGSRAFATRQSTARR